MPWPSPTRARSPSSSTEPPADHSTTPSTTNGRTPSPQGDLSFAHLARKDAPVKGTHSSRCSANHLPNGRPGKVAVMVMAPEPWLLSRLSSRASSFAAV